MTQMPMTTLHTHTHTHTLTYINTYQIINISMYAHTYVLFPSPDGITRMNGARSLPEGACVLDNKKKRAPVKELTPFLTKHQTLHYLDTLLLGRRLAYTGKTPYFHPANNLLYKRRPTHTLQTPCFVDHALITPCYAEDTLGIIFKCLATQKMPYL